MTNLLPIQKVLAALVGAALALVARALGVDLGTDLVNEAAVAGVAVAFAYLKRDPRVVR